MARIRAFFTHNRMNATHNSRPGRARLQPSQPVRLNAARREPSTLRKPSEDGRPARTCAITARWAGYATVAQVSKPAVLPTSKSAGQAFVEDAGLETRETADLEVCATARCRLSRRLGSICDALYKKPLEKAFTLIELLGVLAVLAILAVIIVPHLLHHLDAAVSQQEAATLQRYGSALQSSICRNFYIPGQNDWASNIAAEVGTGTYEVATNSRGQPRVFLIDSNFTIGTNMAGVLPYTQYTNGSTNLPVSPRLMILSTIGKPLPTTYTAADFTNIWNTADGTPPTSATGFSSWTTNDAYDLKVQRINLQPLFYQLILNNQDGTNNLATFSIDTTNAVQVPTNPTNNTGWNSYYLANSVVGLCDAKSNALTRYVLTRNISFVFQNGAWNAQLGYATIVVPTNTFGTTNFGNIASNFFGSPWNTNANSDPSSVLGSMANFMADYTMYMYANTNPPFTTNGTGGISQLLHAEATNVITYSGTNNGTNLGLLYHQ